MPVAVVEANVVADAFKRGDSVVLEGLLEASVVFHALTPGDLVVAAGVLEMNVFANA